jgi:hypothetical protein
MSLIVFLFRSPAGLPGCELRQAPDPKSTRLSRQSPSRGGTVLTGDLADLRALAQHASDVTIEAI